MSELYVRNRQHTRSVNVRLLEKIAATLIAKTCPAEFRIGILLVGTQEMARLHEAFLNQAGSTDVLAFGYSADHRRSLHGEVFICVDEALRQAQRFHTSWQKELVRYLSHGLLHFQGYDDSTPARRLRMKTVENRLVRRISREFCLSRLSGQPRVES